MHWKWFPTIFQNYAGIPWKVYSGFILMKIQYAFHCTAVTVWLEDILHSQVIMASQTACQEVTSSTMRREQGVGVTGEESGEKPNRVSTWNDIPPHCYWKKALDQTLLGQEIYCAGFHLGGSGDERQYALHLAFLLSCWCGVKWASRHPSVRLTTFLSSYWMQRDSWSATVTGWRLAWTVHCFTTMQC